MTHTNLVAAAFALGLAAAPAAMADEAAAPHLYAGLGASGLAGQPFGNLGLAPAGGLDAAYFLPVLDGKLAASVNLNYAQPKSTRTVSDPRVGGGSYSFTLTEQELRLGIGAQFHFLAPSEKLSPYAGVRAKVYFLKETVDGNANAQAFGNNVEQGVKFGGAPYGGVLYRLGPGALLGELEVDLAKVDHTVTGDAHLSAIGLRVGYGMFF